jgi:hypothetical protein
MPKAVYDGDKLKRRSSFLPALLKALFAALVLGGGGLYAMALTGPLGEQGDSDSREAPTNDDQDEAPYLRGAGSPPPLQLKPLPKRRFQIGNRFSSDVGNPHARVQVQA